jgi:hypothetical protein
MPDHLPRQVSRSQAESSEILMTSIIRALGIAFFVLSFAGPLSAHHFKGLPHYNYFENYPQVPEEEFLGQAGNYEMSLVVYDFQGLQRENVQEPGEVRLFLVIFNMLDSTVYNGKLTFEVLDGNQPVHSKSFRNAELENLYSIHHELPDSGEYSIRLTLHDADDLSCDIPFRLSSQQTHWGRWISLLLLVLMTVTAWGARRARLTIDRREARKQNLSLDGGVK